MIVSEVQDPPISYCKLVTKRSFGNRL